MAEGADEPCPGRAKRTALGLMASRQVPLDHEAKSPGVPTKPVRPLGQESRHIEQGG
jgi:hypothetical protein